MDISTRKSNYKNKFVFRALYLYTIYKYMVSNICIERQLQEIVSQKFS